MAQLYRGDPPLAADACYAARRMSATRDVLLAAGDHAWREAAVIAWGPAPFQTTFRALWTDEALVVRFVAHDTVPWHVRTARDECLWEEEVVEIFLDPTCSGTDYAEVEISPANVVCDLRVATPWPRLTSDRAWDWEGLETRVDRRVAGEGTNDLVAPGTAPVATAGTGPAGSPALQPRGLPAAATLWQATAWLPWDGLRSLSREACARVPPRGGHRWRMNVFRIKRPGGPSDPEGGAIYAAWSVPPAGPSFHVVDAFRDLVFVE